MDPSHPFVVQSLSHVRPTLFNPMGSSMPGFPVLHHLLELAQTHIHQVGDGIQPSNPCRPLLLLPSIFPTVRVFSSESALRIRWPKYWSFSISPSNESSGLISFRIDWFGLLAVQGTLKHLLQHHSPKASIIQHLAFFIVQLTVESLKHWLERISCQVWWHEWQEQKWITEKLNIQMLVNWELALKRVKTSAGFFEGKKKNPSGFFLQQILFSIFSLGGIQEKNDLSHSSNEFYSLLNFKYVNLIPRWSPKNMYCQVIDLDTPFQGSPLPSCSNFSGSGSK